MINGSERSFTAAIRGAGELVLGSSSHSGVNNRLLGSYQLITDELPTTLPHLAK